MGSLFGVKAPTVTPPPPPAAPVEAATFKPGGSDKTDTQVKQNKLGKKKLQIPNVATTATTGSGVNTGV